MLVLTRKLNEGILIGNDIEIRVARIEGESVKIAIRAPANLGVYREEIYRQMKDANIDALRKPGDAMPHLKFPITVSPKLAKPNQTHTHQ